MAPEGVLNKLVRDRNAEYIASRGGWSVNRSPNNDAEYRYLLRAKLQEEITEFLEAVTVPEAAEELADILEVIYAIAHDLGLSPDEVDELRVLKRQERGGFDSGVVLVEWGRGTMPKEEA